MKYKDFNWHPYKKLWLDENYEVWPTQSRSDTVGYVREDVVLELVEALEKIAGGWVCVDEAGLTARAALKALEEE